MAATCFCPPAAAIGNILNFDCKLETGIFNKVAVQRLGTPFVDITDEGEWDTKIGATDDTKIQFSPPFGSFVLPGSNAIKFGGNTNETPNGEPLVTGEETVNSTGIFLNTPQEVIASFKDVVSCELNLGIYFIDDLNNIIYAGPGLTGSPFRVLPTTFFVGTYESGGITDPDKNNFEFTFPRCWSKELVVVNAGFNIQGKLNA